MQEHRDAFVCSQALPERKEVHGTYPVYRLVPIFLVASARFVRAFEMPVSVHRTCNHHRCTVFCHRGVKRDFCRQIINANLCHGRCQIIKTVTRLYTCYYLPRLLPEQTFLPSGSCLRTLSTHSSGLIFTILSTHTYICMYR